MKKKQIVLAVMMFSVVAFVATLNVKNNSQMSDLMLNNVDALASSEDNSGGELPTKWICYRDGTVDCPDGSKAEIVYGPYSL